MPCWLLASLRFNQKEKPSLESVGINCNHYSRKSPFPPRYPFCPYLKHVPSECPWVWRVVRGVILMLGVLHLLFYLPNIDIGNCTVAVEDAGDFLKGWSLCFNIKEIDEA